MIHQEIVSFICTEVKGPFGIVTVEERNLTRTRQLVDHIIQELLPAIVYYQIIMFIRNDRHHPGNQFSRQ